MEEVKRTVEDSKFYTFRQNNSGGFFVADDKTGVGTFIIIEAMDINQAVEHFSAIEGKQEHNWCHCCGERWSPELMDEDDAEEKPSLYGRYVFDDGHNMWTRMHAFIHYMDKTIVKVEIK